ncbi:group XIIB secretory phospholipase A2-like protein [Aulostomus maculatus]
MRLRTAALLLLCVSSGMCATLGLFRSPANEEEAPSEDLVPTESVAEATSADTTHKAAPDAEESHSPAAKEPELLAKLMNLERAEADEPAVEKPVLDPAEQLEEDPDRRAAHTELTGEAVTQVDMETGAEAEAEVEAEVEVHEPTPVQTRPAVNKSVTNEATSSWGLGSIRASFQTVHGYFDSLVELVGGRDGVCQYRCRYGKHPQPRPGYQLPEPNGCSSSLVGFQFDLGIPAMTKCCNHLDMCYDTCGAIKYDCDTKFRTCLHDICADLKRSLGFGSQVQACESMADALFSTVWTLGCRPYLNSQRAACVCEEEERDEL